MSTATSQLSAHERIPARERILDTAEQLFYREGIRAIGIDRIIQESGVAKMSLYRNFASKEDLVAAFLARRNERYWSWWDSIVGDHPDSPRRQVRDLFEALVKRVRAAGFRGCSFLNAATEFPETDHLGRAAALSHYEELRRRLLDLATRNEVPSPQALADHWMLLVVGVYTTGGILRNLEAVSSVADAAESLLDKAVKPC